MKNRIEKELIDSISGFKLPEYSEIPDVGLFLEQTAKYISAVLLPLEGMAVTSSMISNYVKKKLITSPVKKQYSRDQIAELIFIAATKSVVSLEGIMLMLDMQRASYDIRTAYEYFCKEFENVLMVAFGAKADYDEIGTENTVQKKLLRNSIIAIAHKAYLGKFINLLQKKPSDD